MDPSKYDVHNVFHTDDFDLMLSNVGLLKDTALLCIEYHTILLVVSPETDGQANNHGKKTKSICMTRYMVFTISDHLPTVF